MPRIRYEDWNPGPAAAGVLVQANAIATSYVAQGYNLTLRQLYYQFVARGLIENSQKEYKRLGDIVNKGRLAGLLDWDHLEDRTRNMRQVQRFRDGKHVVEVALNAFHVDHWTDQPRRVEVWVEKEALAGVVSGAAEDWDCPWFSCRGYVSQSEMWAAAQRFGRTIKARQGVLVLHLGDHDPSGIDMTRDIEDRLSNFIEQDWINDQMPGVTTASRGKIQEHMADHVGGLPAFEVRRIALNMDQVEQYGPPPNPAKLTDSRANDYIDNYGDESWELDALDPATLDALIRSHIEDEVEDDLWQDRVDFEAEHKDRLRGFVASYGSER